MLSRREAEAEAEAEVVEVVLEEVEVEEEEGVAWALRTQRLSNRERSLGS